MGFERAFRKYFAGVYLVFIALAAYFQASGITQLFAHALGATVPFTGGHAVVPSTPVADDDHATNANAILERNPFDSLTPRLVTTTGMAGSNVAELVDIGRAENAPPCEGLRALLVLASSDRAWSVAAIARDGDAQTRIVRVGDQIGHKLVRIVEWNRVVFSTGSSLCQVRMFQSTKADGGPVNAGIPEAVPRTDPRNLAREIASRVQKVSATEFNIERRAIGDLVDRQAELVGSVRLVPQQENGKVIGIQLLGVRPEGVLGLLGIENGDRLETINGFDMTSADGAFQAYARLKTAEHLTVHVNRRGREVNIDYNVQ
jgi:general secretion pathway protein C